MTARPSTQTRPPNGSSRYEGGAAVRSNGPSPVMRGPYARAWRRFRTNRRGYYSLWLFVILFGLSMFAEFLSNDTPLVVHYQDAYYFPVFQTYPETTFGGDFPTEADYLDPYIKEKITRGENWAIYPPNPYSYDTINYWADQPNPAPPSAQNLFGTDDRGRDVLARLFYGFRLSVIFALALTAIGTLIGMVAGALQGYFGGKVDLFAQRFVEVWGSMPELYLLIIFASIFEPSLLLLIVLLSLFGWMGLADYVRAEFLKGRNMDYVRAAQALGVPNRSIMVRHLMPNAMTPVITFLPFRISGAILALTSLDFLGLGVPPTTPSLGELLSQGKDNIEAWWLSLSTFMVLVGTLMLLIFIGEAIREALDPRRG
ncbi:microcin C transport system permease protein [Thiohalomonas denitrificans]|uniref:Microcin C transport system permease protein n=2 Tax=Thiohalomonas denitrificans TaxID=415747 RepID=A0A1G5QPL9_9GAMM|nr:microcin C transport system permease protein [Thiohalomonas denitrificans]